MQKYRNSHSCNIHPVGTCSCGDFNYHSHPSGDSFSMIFSTKPTNHYHHHHKTFNEFEVSYPKITSSSSSPSVDCTLSLGTPSTRQTKVDKSFINHRKSTSCVWDMFQTTKQHQQLQNPSYNSSTTNATTRNVRSSGIGNNPINNNNNNNNTSSGSTRRCANCDTTSTPLWRNGPRGPKSLCNACGIRYKKEERRATITTTNSANPSNITNNDNNSCLNGGSGTTTSWPNHPSAHSTNQRVNSTSYHPTTSLGNQHHHHHEFRFIEDDHHRHRNSTSSTNFHSWRLNVATADRPSLVHDYI